MNDKNPTATPDRISYLNITFSDKGVAEFSGKRCVVFIPRDTVRRIETRIGSRAEKPLVQGIAGLVLCGLGLVGLRMFVNVGVAFLRWEAGFVVFGALGTWLLWETFDKRPYLLVDCSVEKRKLVFHGKTNPLELEQFLRDAARLGYNCA